MTSNAFDTAAIIKTMQAQWGTAQEMATKSLDEMSKVNKDVVDAGIKSSTIMARGAEDISKRAIAFSRSSMEANVAVARGLIGCRNLNDALDLQTSHTKSSYENLIAEASAIQEMSMKVASDAFAPLQAELTAAAEKMTKAAKPA